MNKIKTLLTTLFIIILITISCNKNPLDTTDKDNAEAVGTDKSNLVITYAAGDSESSVTKKVSLPSGGLSGSSISWATSNSSCITIGGVVSRPPFDSGSLTVNLTATISKGTASAVKVFHLTVKEQNTITDIDGNEYIIVKIGQQVWTAENLRTTRYNDGSAIPHITNNETWDSCYSYTGKDAYCYYNNMTNVDSIRKFGALYNRYAINTNKLAPTGWHVPDSTEWNTLENYLIANGFNWDETTIDSKIAKSIAATTDWYTDTTIGAIGCILQNNNKSGFSAFPGGLRYYDGSFAEIGTSAHWWSTSEGNWPFTDGRYLDYRFSGLGISGSPAGCGLSIRLVRN